MIDDKLKNEILGSILIDGVSADENKTKTHILSPNADFLLTMSNGRPSIRKVLISKFELLLKPNLAVNPLEIRCCLCNKPVSFPVWYHPVEAAYNVLHYYVCFNGNSQVDARCYKGR